MGQQRFEPALRCVRHRAQRCLQQPDAIRAGWAWSDRRAGNAQIVTDGNDSNSSTNKYFLHPNLTNLASYFKANKLAFAVNVGTLVKPMNMTDYKTATFPKPPQLFSHADQTNLWNQANTSGTAGQGWGGLCADDLQAQGANNTGSGSVGGPLFPLCVSIAGANRFEIGNVVNNPYQLSSGGLANLSAMCNQDPCGTGNNSVRDQALNELLGATYANEFSGEYGNVFGDARALFAELKPALACTAPYNVTARHFPPHPSASS